MLRYRETLIGENVIGWPQLCNNQPGLWHTPYVDDDLEMELIRQLWQRIERPNQLFEFGLHQAIGHHEMLRLDA